MGPAASARTRTAEWDARAVLCTVAEAGSGGELNQVLGRPPSGHAVFFGKPGLGDRPAVPQAACASSP
ncbi:hypothetical protein [Streptomyces bugieae]|uniref:Uncharacterized protein n=1 Tax=Streptomyces bugieae TaxID=3098223 RepID=A0ABU7NPA0_9ACTN|nr:hypothetical protein [Streptomyces sp. DSM 41528]